MTIPLMVEAVNGTPNKDDQPVRVDVAIIGGGIAGLSCAASLGDRATVVVLESEPTLGYHATGRSAALYTECYGSEVIRTLAVLSRDYLAELDLLSDRGLMFVAPPGRHHRIGELYDQFSPLASNLELLDPADVSGKCSLLSPDHVAGGLYEPDAADVDVDRLQTAYVSAARAAGHRILTSSPVAAIRRSENRWSIDAGSEQVEADVVVNAAGAWADTVARLADVQVLGLAPLLRSVFTFDPNQSTAGWPMMVDVDESWYMKPEGPHMLGSAASEIPHPPGDVTAPELDVALGIKNLNDASNLDIRSVKTTWAGLRTFTDDRVPAVGFARGSDGFFWLAGQGGYGIKTSPALGAIAADLIIGADPARRSSLDRTVISALDPNRFRP